MTRSAASTTRHTGRIRCAIYTRKSSEEVSRHFTL